MSDTIGNNGAAPGGGGSGGSSLGVSTSGVTGPSNLPVLPPNYASSNLGFFTRQSEPVPTAVTTGPDGALYVSNLGAIPYPAGYAYITRIANPTSTTGFDGKVASGTPQVFASGFTEIVSMAFDKAGNLYVLEYLNANGVYDPTIDPTTLPPSKLIRVGLDGVRTTISGDELKLGNYVTVDKANGDVYVAINNADNANGEVLRYRVGADGKTTSTEVVATALNNPRGMSFGPDGNLYVLESGKGTPSNDPNVASAPDVVFIPGLVSERGGYTGAITKLDISGPEVTQEQIYVGLASFREYNPITGADRIISIGPNGLAIGADGTAYVASGGGLAPATAASIAPFSDLTRGLIRVDGLFDGNPADATLTPVFDSVKYGSENGPDGATTLFNTQSNLNDVTFGADGKLYAVDAARNSLYGLGKDGTTVESVTVIPKQPPVLTAPQYAAVLGRGGNPTADYAVEIDQRTTKNANGLPLTPGRSATPPPPAGSGTAVPPQFGPPPGTLPPGPPPAGATPSGPPPASTALPPGPPPAGTTPSGPPPALGTASRGEDATVLANNAANAGVPGDISAAGVPGGFPPLDANFPGPSDPSAPPVTPGNIYTPYFNPFFGYTSNEKLALNDGKGGTFQASNLYSFGDRLADDGGTFGVVPFLENAGVPTPYTTTPYNKSGSLSDGPKWTKSLGQILGVPQTSRDTNFAYESATTKQVGGNPADPFQTTYNFEGQIGLFKAINGRFLPNDVVTVTFGANDITVPGVPPTPALVDSTVDAIISGLQDLADLGAKHFLVTNIPDITLAPLFGDPAIGGALGIDGSVYPALVERFNARLDVALNAFENQSGLDVKELDLNKLFAGIAADPSIYGFSEIKESVLVSLPFPGTQPVYNPDIVGKDPIVQRGTLFVDPFFNPSALGQSIIAETARSALV